jgi:uncharacterized protein (TIGR00251 family)
MKIQVRVKPGSRTEELSREGDSYIVKVKEPAREGKANQEVINLLAEHLSVPKSQIRILRGFRSRNKVIEIVEE